MCDEHRLVLVAVVPAQRNILRSRIEHSINRYSALSCSIFSIVSSHYEEIGDSARGLSEGVVEATPLVADST